MASGRWLALVIALPFLVLGEVSGDEPGQAGAMVKPAAKPKAKPAAKPKAKPAAKPTKAKPAAKPKAKPAAKPTKAKPAAKPKAKPAAKPTKVKPAAAMGKPVAAKGKVGPVYPIGPKGVLAVVGGKQILAKEVKAIHSRARGRIPLEIVLDALILEEVFAQSLKRLKITAPKKAIADFYKRILPMAAAQGFSEEQIRRKARIQASLIGVVEAQVTAKTEAAFFVTERSRFVQQHRIARILVSLGKDSRRNAEARARDIIARLKKGAKWDAVCRAESDDRLAPFDAGDLGWIPASQHRFDPVIASARALKPGQVASEPVFRVNGFHIVRLVAIRTPEIPYSTLPELEKIRVRSALKTATMRKLQQKWTAATKIRRFRGATTPSALFPR